MFQTINRILELQNEPSANKKKEIIEKYKDDEKFCRFLYYALNPMLSYKVSESTLYNEIRNHHRIRPIDGDFFDICEFLSNQKALNNEIIKRVGAYIYSLPEPLEAHLCTKLLARTIRLGVTGKTVNKIIPGLIPEWEVQQAYTIEKYPIKDGEDFYVTEKLNGVRATYYKGRLYARSGIPFDGLEHIINDIDDLNYRGFVFDGELILGDKGSLSDNEAFRVATGIINSESEEKEAITFMIFDMLPVSEFETGESKLTYCERRNQMTELDFSLKAAQKEHVQVLPLLYCGGDVLEIDRLLDNAVKLDKEGLMVNFDTTYKCKRHRGILKVKRFYTMDLPIIGVEEGIGRLSGTLGSFVLDYNGNHVMVGSGFTDRQREEFWENKDKLKGVICEVKYKEISRDKKTGSKSLQFPVFYSLRIDKDTPNSE